MNDLARLALLVRYDIANSIARIGSKAAADYVSTVTTPGAWLVVCEGLRVTVTDRDRDRERCAARDACFAMAGDNVEAAALVMIYLRDDTMTLDAYAAEIAAEALAAGVTL